MKTLAWLLFFQCAVLCRGYCNEHMDYGQAMKEGQSAAGSILSELGSPRKIENRISGPVTDSEKPFATFGPDSEKQQFSAPIVADTNKYELHTETFRQDDGTFAGVNITVKKNGSQDRYYFADHKISGVCAKGFISEQSGEKIYFKWQVSQNLKISAVRREDILPGCICITYECGMGTGTDQTLTEQLAAGIVTTVQRANSSLAIIKSASSQNRVIYTLTQTAPRSDRPEQLFTPGDDSALNDQAEYAKQRVMQDNNSVYSILNTTHRSADYRSQSLQQAAQRADQTAWSSRLADDGFSYQGQDSRGVWGIQKYALPEMPVVQACEQVCKISRQVTDTAMTEKGPVSDLRRSGSQSEETVFRVCQDGSCPAGPGETIVRGCACKSDFKQIAAAMQMFNAAGKDIICSKK